MPSHWQWCEMKHCMDTCENEEVCHAQWFDHNQMFHEGTCEEYYDAIDEVCDPETEDCEDDRDDECDPMTEDCDDECDWWNEDCGDDNGDDDCVPECTEAFACPDSPFDHCFMTECHCEGDDEGQCFAEWYDHDNNFHEAACEDYHHEQECKDWDHSMDDCRFEQMDKSGDVWHEVCNEHAEEQCADFSCTKWIYHRKDDFWEERSC